MTKANDDKTLFEKITTENFFADRKLLESVVIDLDGIKMEESDASQASHSHTPVPKPDDDANNIDVDSATIERLLTKQSPNKSALTSSTSRRPSLTARTTPSSPSPFPSSTRCSTDVCVTRPRRSTCGRCSTRCCVQAIQKRQTRPRRALRPTVTSKCRQRALMQRVSTK